MFQMNTVRFASATVLLALLVACGTTKITDTWQDPGFHRKDMGDVLVVAVTGDKSNRIFFERGFAKVLGDSGISATASYDAIGGATPTRAGVDAYLARNKQIRYVIAARYGGKEITTEHVPESVRSYYTGPYYPYYGGYWDRYGDTVTMTREAYVDTKTKVILTTSIYDVSTQKLVWVGRSTSFEVGAISAGAKELAGEVVRHIKR